MLELLPKTAFRQQESILQGFGYKVLPSGLTHAPASCRVCHIQATQWEDCAYVFE